MRMVKKLRKICQNLNCKVEFFAASPNARFCPDCRKIRKSESQKECRKAAKERAKYEALHKSKSITDILFELREYNRKNNTNLSYGKYVQICHNKEV